MSRFEMVLYKVLFFVGLGWTYNKIKCRLNVYSKWPDGRCQYCGVKHGRHWTPTLPTTVSPLEPPR